MERPVGPDGTVNGDLEFPDMEPWEEPNLALEALPRLLGRHLRPDLGHADHPDAVDDAIDELPDDPFGSAAISSDELDDPWL